MKSFQPGELWPDNNGVHINAHGGGILLHEGTYYWYGEHKVAGRAGNAALIGVHVYSSSDLYNWTDEGIALEVVDHPESDITKGCILERPKVIYNERTGKFVMWFHLELKGQGYKAARSGVAISDSPIGPFQFIESSRQNAGIWPSNVEPHDCRPLDEGQNAALAYKNNLLFRHDFEEGQMARDMTLFVDDDGTAFHIYASEENSTLQISELSDDYLRPTGRYIRVFPGRQHEAPALFKHQGRYFLFSSDCTGWTPNPARLSVADSIWGPWEELGNPCIGTESETATTFGSQSTHVLPVADKPGAFVFMADRWRPSDAIDGRYVWLPIEFDQGIPKIRWYAEWDLDFFVDEYGVDRYERILAASSA